MTSQARTSLTSTLPELLSGEFVASSKCEDEPLSLCKKEHPARPRGDLGSLKPKQVRRVCRKSEPNTKRISASKAPLKKEATVL